MRACPLGQAISTSAISASLLFGSLWALGSGCVVIALYRYEAALSKLAPLYNTNTLVAIVLSLIIFAEWQQVDLVKLLGGAVLIVLGGILVSLA
jgi:transporter family protein